MKLICDKCDCEMTEIVGFWSTKPRGWICPKCKYKVILKE